MAKKTVNSDIYNIADLIDGIRQLYLPNEDEDTLSIGMYGYIGDIESHRLQTQVQMTGELANESFPSRARLERNVITHAILAGIDDINAVPAKMSVFMIFNESDIQSYIKASVDNTFIVDRECPIYLGEYEFHLEYDIILKAIKTDSGKISYSAHYNMDTSDDTTNHTYKSVKRLNPSSTITNAYLAPPAVVTASNERYIYITTLISQVQHNVEYKKIVTSNIVDNKTVNFEFEDGELAYFEVHCTETDDDFYLTPIFEGSNVPNGVTYYCWYQYIDTNLIRVRFDRSSYMPGLNAEVEILYKTTKGDDGNITYTEDAYADMSSSIYGYNNITALITTLTDATGGKDRKTKKELQGIIPKVSLARGSYTTITDLNNYFEMLDDENGRVIIQKKIDNQIERVYYGYLVVKDANNNIVPSNTIDVHLPLEYLDKATLTDSESPRFVLKSGACIVYKNGKGYINTDPLPANGYRFTGNALSRGKRTTAVFNATIDEASASFDAVSASIAINDSNTSVITIPNSDVKELEKYAYLRPGRKYSLTYTVTSVRDNSKIAIIPKNKTDFNVSKAYYYTTDPTDITEIDTSTLAFTNKTAGTEYTITYVAEFNHIDHDHIIESGIAIDEDELVLTDTSITCYASSEYDAIIEDNVVEELEDYMQLSVGKLYSFTISCMATKANSTIKIVPSNTSDFDYYEAYYYTINSENITTIKDLTIENVDPSTEYHITYVSRLNSNANTHTDNTIKSGVTVTEDGTTIGSESVIDYVPTISYSVADDILTCTVSYLSISKTYAPYVVMKLSEGLTYNVGTLKVTYDDKTFNMEPSTYPLNDNNSFIYTNPFAISINQYHLYSAFYMMAVDEAPFLQFISNNDDKTNAQFIGTNVYWKRPFLGANKDKYTLSFTITQSIQEDLGLVPDPEDLSTIKVKAIVVFYRDGSAYRYRTMDIDETTCDVDNYTYGFTKTFDAIDLLDNDNNIRVENVQVSGQVEEGAESEYGYFNPSTETRIFTLVSLPDIYGNYSLNGLDAICPELTGWTLTNEYKVNNGLTFYYNYAEIMGSAVTPFGDLEEGSTTLDLEGFDVMNVPLIGYKYAMDETLSDYMIAALNYRKAYIDNSLSVFENSFGIDFKLFNTYGPAKTYYIIRDKNDNGLLDETKEYIDRVNLTLYFRIRLISANDSYTEANIKNEIKEYIENLAEITDLHIPNLITEITNNYSEQITYIEYLGFNSYGPNIQHIYKDSSDDISIHTAPEFLNINNSVDASSNLIPDVVIYVSDI